MLFFQALEAPLHSTTYWNYVPDFERCELGKMLPQVLSFAILTCGGVNLPTPLEHRLLKRISTRVTVALSF